MEMAVLLHKLELQDRLMVYMKQNMLFTEYETVVRVKDRFS